MKDESTKQPEDQNQLDKHPFEWWEVLHADLIEWMTDPSDKHLPPRSDCG